MCGIAGFIDKKSKLTNEERVKIVRAMLERIKHRGGDAFGVEASGNVTIGHTRLSIVDTSDRANQPMIDDKFVLSYNGEIYNHNNLRKTYLKNKNISSYSDTATLFELLKTFPLQKVLSFIQGMYAFSFLNETKRTLFLALDKQAIKPLYYIETPEYFAWGSEIKAFQSLPCFKLEFDDELLKEYLIFRHIAGKRTLFKGVQKMRGGEYLAYSLDKNSYTTKTHSFLRKASAQPKLSLEKVLEHSVREHLMSDVPVGVQLSGGVDSSIVAIFAKKHANSRLHTFSIGLEDPKWNEFIYSDKVAKLLGTEHHKIIFTKKDFLRLFEKLTYHLDEPIVHPNTIPMYLVAKEARKYTKVLLTGEGADEVFLGYNRYIQKNTDDLIISNAFSVVPDISKLPKDNKRLNLNKRKELLRGAKLLNKNDAKSFYDIYTYLPHVLSRQDKAGMAANIENRVPFLYDPVVQYGFNLNKKIGKLGGKTPVKKIALKYLPEDLVLREKCGFGLPIADWLRDEEALLPKLLKITNHPFTKKYLVISEVKNLAEKHLSKEEDNSVILFSILSLIVWYDVFLS